MRVISVKKLLEQEYKELPITGKWNEMFPGIANNFRLFFGGPPKSGKSTVATAFLNHLAHVTRKKVLYVAAEEIDKSAKSSANAAQALRSTAKRRVQVICKQEKVSEFFDITPDTPNFNKAEDLEQLKKYAYICLDSAQIIGINKEGWHNIDEQLAGTGLLIVSQVNNKEKTGMIFMEHDMDAIAFIKHGTAHITGRLGEPKDVHIFTGKGQTMRLDF